MANVNLNATGLAYTSTNANMNGKGKMGQHIMSVGNGQLVNDKVTAVYIWDAQGYDTWREAPLSWNTELGTFPDIAYIIGTTSSIEIIDAVSETLYMRFEFGGRLLSTANAIPSGLIPTMITSVDSKLIIAMTSGNSQGGLYVIDFWEDSIQYISDETAYASWSKYLGKISERNDALGYELLITKSTRFVLPSKKINGIHSEKLSGNTFTGIATDAGVIIIDWNRKLTFAHDTYKKANDIHLCDGDLYFAQSDKYSNTGSINVKYNYNKTHNNFSSDTIYHGEPYNRNPVTLGGVDRDTPLSLSVIKDKSSFGTNIIIASFLDGVTVIDTDETSHGTSEPNGRSRFYINA